MIGDHMKQQKLFTTEIYFDDHQQQQQQQHQDRKTKKGEKTIMATMRQIGEDLSNDEMIEAELDLVAINAHTERVKIKTESGQVLYLPIGLSKSNLRSQLSSAAFCLAVDPSMIEDEYIRISAERDLLHPSLR